MDRNPALLSKIQYLFFAQSNIFSENIFDLCTAGPRKVNKRMTLIQYPPCVRSVGRQMVSHQAGDLEVPPDLQHLIQQVTHSVSDLFVR